MKSMNLKSIISKILLVRSIKAIIALRRSA